MEQYQNKNQTGRTMRTNEEITKPSGNLNNVTQYQSLNFSKRMASVIRPFMNGRKNSG
jgi:hypothetical protein